MCEGGGGPGGVCEEVDQVREEVVVCVKEEVDQVVYV